MTSIPNSLLLRGKSGPAVSALRKALAQALGDGARHYPGLPDGDQFDSMTESALRAWQAATGLVADGIAGPRTLAALGLLELPPLGLEVDLEHVRQLFPCTRSSSIDKNLPYVAAALAAFGLCEREFVIAALGTIRAETEGFVPIPEQPSHFNTWPGQATFSRYENLATLGNSLPGDGARFRGRGYVQLTGRDNYDRYGKLLDVDLLQQPDSACAPEVAACLLAAFLSAHRDQLRQAMSSGDLKGARRIVNGGSHGLDRFEDTVERAVAAWPALAVRRGKAVAAKAAAKIQPPLRAKLDVSKDPADLRDRAYQPPPRSLPERFPSDQDIRNHVRAYQRAGLVLNQGREGACTGFGLACVVNYLRWIRAGTPERLESVSPRMLYQFARRNDEYAGEDYEGSSCRGALKGWYGNGVCLESDWPYLPGQDSQPSPGWEERAIENTLGVYYRIQTHDITDLQAAISEVGAVYVSAFTHDGWDHVRAGKKAPASHGDLPVIAYDGGPSRTGGHAFALVGFNRQGFVIQNSWGSSWGAGGFAVIRYDDWHDNAMDAWVAAMGVPGVIESRIANGPVSGAQAQAGAAQPGWWDKTTAYRHSIVLGNNGHVDRYDTVDGISRTLQHQACVLPDTWFRGNGQARKRLVLYAHGGLNSESDAIARVQAMGRYFLGNGCYPLFLVWKSGVLESITDIIKDRHARKAPAGLAGGWLDDQLSDPLLEKLVGRPLARPLWSEMKENAELASHSGRGGDLLAEALNQLAKTWGENFELHLIGHSAGSIMLGRMLERLKQKDLADHVRSVHLYAPACSVGFANRYYAPHEDIMQRLYLHLLSDRRERNDNVGQIYRKSLLYFVSNALEADPRTPILGLQNVFQPDYRGWDGSASTNEDLLNWRTCAEQSKLADRLTVHDDERFITRIKVGAALPEKSISASHGGFDNNVAVIEQTLKRITGMSELTMAVDNLVGF